jgi:hypothetical protein
MPDKDQYKDYSINQAVIGYSYRVWIFSFIISSLLYFSWIFIHKTTFAFGGWIVFAYLIIVAFHIGVALPAMLIYMLVFWKVYYLNRPAIYKKILLTVTTLSALWLVAWLFPGDYLFSLISIDGFIIFSVVFSVLSFIFRLRNN